MHCPAKASLSHLRPRWFLTFFAAMLLIASAQAQTLTVLHNFMGGNDGASPRGGVTLDRAGNLYGTASTGGGGSCQGGCGTVFKLSHTNSGWTFAPLYEFNGEPDGADPVGKVVFGPDGRLYGTTYAGGMTTQNECTGCGTVFALRPPSTFCQTVVCYWSEQQLYLFGGSTDGYAPTGDIAFDASGNLYGTAYYGGYFSAGTVYELSPPGGGGQWTFSSPHLFEGNGDGQNPYGGVTLDAAGNIYGTTEYGGSVGLGMAYELVAGQDWGEIALHSFNGSDGSRPLGAVLLDASGAIYGTTNRGGATGNGGQAFQLTESGGSWTLTDVQAFTGISGPWGDLVMDSAGNLYGTTEQEGADNFGSVFKLTFSNGNWVRTDLHDFTGQDGAYPRGSLAMDANGNLYGIATAGGPHNLGIVWEITP